MTTSDGMEETPNRERLAKRMYQTELELDENEEAIVWHPPKLDSAQKAEWDLLDIPKGAQEKLINKITQELLPMHDAKPLEDWDLAEVTKAEKIINEVLDDFWQNRKILAFHSMSLHAISPGSTPDFAAKEMVIRMNVRTKNGWRVGIYRPFEPTRRKKCQKL